MDSSEPVHPDYLKGFNEGYLLSKHLPDLAEKICDAVKNSPYAEGFKGGKDQCVYEQKEVHRPSWLKDHGLSKFDNNDGRAKEKDKNEREPEW